MLNNLRIRQAVFLLFCLTLHIFLVKTDRSPTVVDVDTNLPLTWGYELLRVDETDDEDVIYLRTRATGDVDCEENDCASYSAWVFSAEEEEEIRKEDEKDKEKEEEYPGEGNEGSQAETVRESWSGHRLTFRNESIHVRASGGKKGNAKEMSICEGTMVDGVKSPAFKVFSFSYPNNKYVENHFQKVYDFEDPFSPNSDEWYQLKNIARRYESRTYDVEHILEFQMLKRFLQGDRGMTNKEEEEKEERKKEKEKEKEEEKNEGKGKGKQDESTGNPETICQIMLKYWTTPIEFEVTELTQKGNNWIQPEIKKTKNMFAIEYVAQQYPGGVKSSPFVDEFVVLERYVNQKKKHLWSGEALSQHPIWLGTGAPSRNNKENGNTMQFHLQYNQYLETYSDDEGNSKTRLADSRQNEGKCHAIKKFRDMIGVYKYHQRKEIVDIMTKQIKRVGEAFELMDTKVLPGTTITGPDGNRPTYESQNMRKKWFDFMKEEFDQRIKKIEEWMEVRAGIFEKMSEGQQSGELGKMYPRDEPNKDQCGVATDKEVLDRMKLALKAYKERGEWKNPVTWEY